MTEVEVSYPNRTVLKFSDLAPSSYFISFGELFRKIDEVTSEKGVVNSVRIKDCNLFLFNQGEYTRFVDKVEVIVK